jgi:hypothetical protein
VIGGGFRASRIGELAIGSAEVLLKADGRDITLQPIRHDPDEAGLLGNTQLVPRWMLSGHQAILAVDIGGTTIRTGVVALEWRKHALTEVRMATTKTGGTRTPDLGVMPPWTSSLPLRAQIKRSEKKQPARTFIGIGCPGLINEAERSNAAARIFGQLGSSNFNLPRLIRDAIPEIAGEADSDAQRCGRSGTERSALDAQGKNTGEC